MQELASRKFMCAQTYWLNGRELSEKLEIDRPSLYYSSLVLKQCLFFMALCYTNRSFSWLDNRNVKVKYSYILRRYVVRASNIIPACPQSALHRAPKGQVKRWAWIRE
ncbi:hypothetical protein F5B18DRAFT_602846 [Nemania serpens]|nr:hypothetical protein F5B18DRAFT_602846 [Nemania serpens]